MNDCDALFAVNWILFAVAEVGRFWVYVAGQARLTLVAFLAPITITRCVVQGLASIVNVTERATVTAVAIKELLAARARLAIGLQVGIAKLTALAVGRAGATETANARERATQGAVLTAALFATAVLRASFVWRPITTGRLLLAAIRPTILCGTCCHLCVDLVGYIAITRTRDSSSGTAVVLHLLASSSYASPSRATLLVCGTADDLVTRVQSIAVYNNIVYLSSLSELRSKLTTLIIVVAPPTVETT